MSNDFEDDEQIHIELTAQIVASYVSNNPVAADKLPELIAEIHLAVKALQHPQEPVAEKKEPAVSVRKSLGHDKLICLEDGLSFKSLKRHLKSHHGLSPDQYREKWGLPSDYPMVAPAYAARRSELAKSIGLGRKPKDAK